MFAKDKLKSIGIDQGDLLLLLLLGERKDRPHLGPLTGPQIVKQTDNMSHCKHYWE